MSNTPLATPTPPASSAPASNALSQFAVGSIPAFKKAPANYAQAAAKSKPSPPAVNGKEAVAAGGAHSRKPSAAVDNSSSPSAKAPAARVSGADAIAFGSVNDKNSTLSTSPAAPPAVNGNPKTFGSVVAEPVTTKPTINLHSFFTGTPSPSPASQSIPAAPPAAERRPAAYDSQSRSPQPIPSVLANAGGPHHHNTQLSSNSRSFAPGSGSTPSFVPQQFASPSPQQFNPPYHSQQQQHGGSPYLQSAKPPAQNIPNGANNSYGGPGGPSSNSQGGPRSGSFVGSPVMQHQMQRNQQQSTPNRYPTSPRLSNSGLPTQQGMMYPGQGQTQWQQPQQYNNPQYGYYNNYQQGAQYGGPQAPVPSGTSTPSGGIRTPAPGPPASPSISMQQPPLSATSAQFAPNPYPISPIPSSAILPQHPNFQVPRPGQFGATGALVNEFKPSGAAVPFSPSPRKSAAIKIRNPKEIEGEKAAKDAAAGIVKPVVEVKPVEVVEKTTVVEKVETEAVQVKAVEVVAEEKKEVEAKKVEALVEEVKVVEVVEEKKVVVEEKKVAVEEKKVEAEVVVPKVEVVEKEVPVVVNEDAQKVPVETVAPIEPEVEADVATPLPIIPSPSTPVNGSEEVKTPSEPINNSLNTARPIDNLNEISYPAGIDSPRPELNADAEPGKYRYDREFLMQFMAVCQEKPDQLPNLEAIGMLDAGSDANARPGFAGGRRVASMGPPAVPSRGGAPAAGFGSRTPSLGQFSGGMGNFGGGAGLSSEDRFKASLAGGSRSSSAGGFPSGGRGGSMSRTSSQSGTIMSGTNFVPSGGAGGGSRIRSNRGKTRDPERGSSGKPGGHTTGQGFEDAAPLEATANRWTPTVVGGAPSGSAADAESPEMVQRKVKALLNKLTLEKFDSISDQILAWANKSEHEVDGRILRQVIALIFEKATDEANWSEMYARLCRKLMEKVSIAVTDDNVKASDGTPVAGGNLFRKYLLNRCQEDYESGWKQKEVAAAAAAGKAADDNAKKEANEAAKKELDEAGEAASSSKEEPKEAELLSDEYYAAQKAKRRGLGLVRFIGELYRLQMLTERIMHECIKKLLANTDSPEEEDVESLCRLLTTVGKLLDSAKAKNHLDIYFSRMKLITDNPKMPSRIRFMIQDVLELRKERWQPRHDSAGPKLISEIHSDAQKATEESARRTASSSGKGLPRLSDQMSRPGSRRGQGRDNFGVPATSADGWSVPTPQRPAKAGDLSSFGKIREQASNISLAGPSGHFAKAKAKEAARPTTPSNPFALLSSGGDTPVADAPVSQRPRLVMAPRTKPLEGEVADESKEEEAPVEEEEEEEDDGAIDPNAVSMSRAEGERRAGNSVKEFFSVKSLAEGIASVEALPVEYRGILITAFVDAVMGLKADQVSLTRQLFNAVATKGIVSHPVLLESLTPLIVNLIDLSVDMGANAWNFAVLLLIGAGITREETVVLSQKLASEDEPEEDELEAYRQKLLTAYDDRST